MRKTNFERTPNEPWKEPVFGKTNRAICSATCRISNESSGAHLSPGFGTAIDEFGRLTSPPAGRYHRAKRESGLCWGKRGLYLFGSHERYVRFGSWIDLNPASVLNA